MSGWNAASQGWSRTRRNRRDETVAEGGGRWVPTDVVALLVAFAIRWELGIAFLALKLWHQASGRRISTFAFAREKWDAAVAFVRTVGNGLHLPMTLHVGARSSGSPAFDRWRQDELARIAAERSKLADAEAEFARYRDELLRARDNEHFDRFMRSRDAGQ